MRNELSQDANHFRMKMVLWPAADSKRNAAKISAGRLEPLYPAVSLIRAPHGSDEDRRRSRTSPLDSPVLSTTRKDVISAKVCNKREEHISSCWGGGGRQPSSLLGRIYAFRVTSLIRLCARVLIISHFYLIYLVGARFPFFIGIFRHITVRCFVPKWTWSRTRLSFTLPMTSKICAMIIFIFHLRTSPQCTAQWVVALPRNPVDSFEASLVSHLDQST